MSRIPCTQSTHWIAASLRAGPGTGAGLGHSSPQTRNAIARNRLACRISVIGSADHTRACLFSTALPRLATRKENATTSQIESAKLDSISQTLINDLYTRPSSSKSKVTLADVLALKPATDKISVEEFNKLKDMVAASFNVTQLKGVLRSQNMPSGGKKSVLVNQIMILMHLQVVAPKSKRPVVEDPYTGAEPVMMQKAFPSNKRELFFILGSEGDSLRGLEREKNVRISINISNETYVIRGASESIQEAQDHIRHLVAVTEEAWDISSYGNRDLVMNDSSALEDIARRSETFVSAGEGDKLIIAGRSSRDMEEAKRLFDLKLHESVNGVESMTFLHQEDELKAVAMLPVFDSVTMNVDENQGSYFRIAQTEPYADKTLENPAIHPVQSSPSSIGSMEELRNHLRSSMEGAYQPHQAFDLSAHFGQVLFQHRNPQMTQLPLQNAFDTLELEGWLKSAGNPYFFQSLPFFKAVSKLPLVSPKSKTIEVEYLPSSSSSSRHVQSSSSQDPSTLRPIHITLQLNSEGELFIQDGKVIDQQTLTNLMLLGQPTDLQIRSELTTRLETESPLMKDLLNHTTLPFANRLQCPSFYSFKDSTVSTPAVAQMGLSGSTPSTHTLKSVLFRTSGVFDYQGLPLVASDVTDQYGHVRRQELKLLPVPLKSRTGSNEDDLSSATASSTSITPLPATTPLEHWDDFMKAALHLSRTL